MKNIFKLTSLLFIISIFFIQCNKDTIETETVIIPAEDQKANVNFTIQTVGLDGSSISDVSVQIPSDSRVFSTDDNGISVIRNLTVTGIGKHVKLSKEGFIDQFIMLDGADGSNKTIKAQLIERPQPLVFSGSGSLALSNGMNLSLPSSFKYSNGNSYDGEVFVYHHYFDPTNAQSLDAAPGGLLSIADDGALSTLASYGMYTIELTDASGSMLQIADGETATLEFPLQSSIVNSAPETIPLWYFDESNGNWIQEGEAKKENGRYMASVNHFTTWNCDIPFDPIQICFQLVDASESTLPNQEFIIQDQNTGSVYSFGTTDSDGNGCVYVPINLEVNMTLVDENEILVDPVTIPAQSQSSNLGTIQFNISIQKIIGTVLDCEMSPVDGAVVTIVGGSSANYISTNSNGDFEYVIWNESSIEITAYDFNDLVASNPVTIPLSGEGIVQVDPIELCDDIVSGQNIPVAGNITNDVTWIAGNNYILFGTVFIEDGASLTIEPGVVVKGQPGSGVNSSMLVAARGSKIFANGTAEAPIIFTSIADQLTSEMVLNGDIVSPNLDPSNSGLWGGLIVLGNAPISAQDINDENVIEIQMEGIPSSETSGLYGGNDAADNSGILNYVSIRHGGTNIGAGNEINGLTLAGVGFGTTIENIEVVANLDDGIEWFGGTCNATNIAIWNCGDDGLDSDQAWNGTCNNWIVQTPNGGSGLELDGPEGSLTQGCNTFTNGTIYVGNNIDHIIDMDDNTNTGVTNLYITGIELDYDDPDRSFESLDGDGNCMNSSWEITLPDGFDSSTLFTNVPSGLLTEVEEGNNTVGANESVFSWTWLFQ